MTGIEPVIPAWQPSVSPQHFTCRETARDRAGESRGAEDGNRTRDPGTADRCVTSTLHLRGAGGRGAGRRLAPRLGGDRRPSRSEGGASRALDRSVVIRGAARPAAGARSWGATSGDRGTVADRAWRRFLASFGARTASRGARAWSHPPGVAPAIRHGCAGRWGAPASWRPARVVASRVSKSARDRAWREVARIPSRVQGTRGPESEMEIPCREHGSRDHEIGNRWGDGRRAPTGPKHQRGRKAEGPPGFPGGPPRSTTSHEASTLVPFLGLRHPS